VRDSFEQFDFDSQIERLERPGLLFMPAKKFAGIDLHPRKVSNAEMGSVFEELRRTFAELSNETARPATRAPVVRRPLPDRGRAYAHPVPLRRRVHLANASPDGGTVSDLPPHPSTST
jgi:hypothetical protein